MARKRYRDRIVDQPCSVGDVVMREFVDGAHLSPSNGASDPDRVGADDENERPSASAVMGWVGLRPLAATPSCVSSAIIPTIVVHLLIRGPAKFDALPHGIVFAKVTPRQSLINQGHRRTTGLVEIVPRAGRGSGPPMVRK